MVLVMRLVILVSRDLIELVVFMVGVVIVFEVFLEVRCGVVNSSEGERLLILVMRIGEGGLVC